MRIPNVISKNTICAYELPEIWIRQEKLKSDNFIWDESFVKTLRECCLIFLAKKWKDNPIYDEITVPADRTLLVELLPCDLPVELTIPIITDDNYWERCYTFRWPEEARPEKTIKDMSTYCGVPLLAEDEDIESKYSDIHDNDFKQKYMGQDHSLTASFASLRSSPPTSYVSSAGPSSIASSVKEVLNKKSWKQCFAERYFREQLETMVPDSFNEEYIKDLTDLIGDYIFTLNIKSLKGPKASEICANDTDHISLEVALAGLPNLADFSVCFTEGNLGENFSWDKLKVSERDCRALGEGLINSEVKIVRVVRSDIDCAKLKFFLRPLEMNKSIRILDLSHCRIGDEGALALAAVLQRHPVLETLVLVNNRISEKGAQGLAYYLWQEGSRLVHLNLKLNPLGNQGCMFIATALAKGAVNLMYLSVSACELTHAHFGQCLSLNNTLQKLDMSSNRLGKEAGDFLLLSLETNTAIIYLDLRMCNIPEDTLMIIESILKRNWENRRGVIKRPPFTYQMPYKMFN